MQKANPLSWFSKITTDEYNEAFRFLQQADGLYWKVLMAAQARASRKNNKLTGLDECEFFLSQTETRSFGLGDSQHGKLYRVINHLVKLNFLSKVGSKTGSKNAAVYRLNKGFMGLLDFQIGNRQAENKNDKKKDICFSQDDFNKFWEIYPKRVEIDEAIARWKTLMKRKKLPSLEILLAAIENQLTWRARADPDEFIPQWKKPATWLNKGCWEDEVPEDQESNWSRRVRESKKEEAENAKDF